MQVAPHLASRWLAAVRSGTELHHAALEAVALGRWKLAAVRFEAAALRYRRDIEVEALARLRVHEQMAQVLAGADPAHEAALEVEIARRLCQLDRIESLAAPFDLVEARELLGTWRAAGHGAHSVRGRASDSGEPFARAA